MGGGTREKQRDSRAIERWGCVRGTLRSLQFPDAPKLLSSLLAPAMLAWDPPRRYSLCLVPKHH